MDVRSQASLLAAVLCLAMAASVYIRPRRRRVHRSFAAFSSTVAVFYASTFLDRALGGPYFSRVHLVAGVVMPLVAVRFFRSFVDDDEPRLVRLHRAAWMVVAPILIYALTRPEDEPAVAVLATIVVTTFFAAAVALLFIRSARAPSRLERAKLRYLCIVGGAAGTFTLFEYAPLVGIDIPELGTVLILLFLYMLSQSITRDRLIDLYELAGRAGVLTVVALFFSGIIWTMREIAGEPRFIHMMVSAMAVLLLFDSVRGRVAPFIARVFFHERTTLEEHLAALRRRIAGALEVDDLSAILMEGLEESRRVTHAALYLAARDGHSYSLAAHLGSSPPSHIETAPARPFLTRLLEVDALVLENLERDFEDLRSSRRDREAETLYEVIRTLEALHGGIALAIATRSRELYGFLIVTDDRIRDAFSIDEVQFLVGLATQVALSLESGALHRQLMERDRLATLGEMAAGLAHEIRNPLGAIKASAQLLAEPSDTDEAPREFLDIIVEETDRLARVVGSFLDYAKPGAPDPEPIDLGHAVERTMRMLDAELAEHGIDTSLRLDPDRPKVRVDAEHVRQILLNLVRNAIEATGRGGRLHVEVARIQRKGVAESLEEWIELRVTDDGPGIDPEILPKLFVPFVTTKANGSGLGLAISQRLANAASGRIDVRSEKDRGTTFVVTYPGVPEVAEPTP
jgi:two-component system, NtrC family, sensor histidine kinase HydH